MARPSLVSSLFALGFTHPSMLLPPQGLTWLRPLMLASGIVQLGSSLSSHSSAHAEPSSAALERAHPELPLSLHSFVQPRMMPLLVGMACPRFVFLLFVLGFTHPSLFLSFKSFAWSSSDMPASRAVQLGISMPSHNSAHLESSSTVLELSNPGSPLILHNLA